jgi:SAM-dependent methyltransferase
MNGSRSTERFTSRVENYVRYRPDYPTGIVPLLQEQTGLSTDWTVADIGSGPGNLTRLFLDNGYTVIGVEPNDAMREAGEVLMAGYSSFTSVKGTAEATTLPSESIDFITAGQAFHWFDPAATRTEFQRILKNPGWVALIWNKRPEGSAAIMDAWNEMLREHSPEYSVVGHRDDAANAGMSILFGEGSFRKFTLPHEQVLDAEAVWGRLISSSYTPLPGEPGHDEIKKRSQEIFDEFSVDGALRFPYETQIFVGKV